LLFREAAPLSLVEEESDTFEIEDAGEMSEDNVEEEGWDDLFLEEDDSSESDDKMDVI